MVKVQKLPSGQLVITIPKILAEYEGLEYAMWICPECLKKKVVK